MFRKRVFSNKHMARVCLIESILSKGFLDGSVVENLPVHTGDLSSIPGLGRSLGVGNSNPLQYSCLGNPMDRGAWQATVHGLQRVRHDLATKQQNNNNILSKFSSSAAKNEDVY